MTYLTKEQLLDIGLTLKKAEYSNRRILEELQKLTDDAVATKDALRNALDIINKEIHMWSNGTADTGLDL